MLKPADQPESARHGRRWWLLLLVPPVALLTWALVGIDVKVGGWSMRSGWSRLPPPPALSLLGFNSSIQGSPTTRLTAIRLGNHLFWAFYSWPKR